MGGRQNKRTELTEEQKQLIDKALNESQLGNSVALKLYIKKYYNIILPNNEKIPLNYPIMDDSRRLDNVGRYDNPNQSTDKYFDQNYYETRINEGIQTGNQIQQIFL